MENMEMKPGVGMYSNMKDDIGNIGDIESA